MIRLFLFTCLCASLAICGLAAQQPAGKKSSQPPTVQPILQNQADGKAQGQPVKAGEPEAIKTKEGKTGWKVAIPGNRPLATPALADGKLFIGGGFGSHEFYAFDAKTGKSLWIYRTGDDGPTAAVVEGGYVAFNTESCELEIITMEGKRIWKKWLGDPLMSMPAISKGKVYMAYPDSKGDYQHHLICFDIKDGKENWKKPIAGDIITAPVIDGDKIYLATVEGTMYCFGRDDGKLAWSEKKNATSSPLVWDGKCYFSNRFEKKVRDKDGKEVTQQNEALAGRAISGGDGAYQIPATEQPAEYLDFGKRAASSKMEKANKASDASVGFAQAPAAAGLSKAQSNLGQATVAGVWSYQGSRPFLYKEKMYSVMGDTLKCVDPKNDKVLWIRQLHKEKDAVDAGVTPPALVNRQIFVGTSKGEIICLSVEDGKELWRATVGEPIVFQPAVAYGRVYAASSTGRLYCIDTGDLDNHGWMMWGANAQHSGRLN